MTDSPRRSARIAAKQQSPPPSSEEEDESPPPSPRQHPRVRFRRAHRPSYDEEEPPVENSDSCVEILLAVMMLLLGYFTVAGLMFAPFLKR